MKLEITWTERKVTQVRELINHCRSDKKSQTFITMNSPIYEAMENGSFVLDLGDFGKHPFTVKVLDHDA